MQKEKVPNNRIQLARLSEEHTIAFKEEMQKAQPLKLINSDDINLLDMGGLMVMENK